MIAAALLLVSRTGMATAQSIAGDWTGAMDTGRGQLHLVLHIVGEKGKLTATMDSPDQGARGIPVTSVTRTGDLLRIEMKQIDGVFQGKISGDRTTIDGTWTQNAGNLPLALKRIESWILRQ